MRWACLLCDVGGSFSASSLSELLTVLKFLSLIISALFYSTAHLYTSHGPNHKMITIFCAFFTLLTCKFSSFLMSDLKCFDTQSHIKDVFILQVSVE